MNKIRPTVFMFAGQGSQYFYMGKELYEAGGTFGRWMRHLDSLMQEYLDRSVLASLYGSHGKGDILDDTLLSHPAIFMVEVALAKELIDRGIRPDLTLGVSMGAFAAAAIAGCISIEDASVLVARQACELSSRCSRGGMIAVLSSTSLYQHEQLRRHSVIASYNLDTNFVLSARAQHLTGVVDFLRKKGVTFQSLPVLLAYHSPWIDEAQVAFDNTALQMTFSRANIPLVCCAKSDPLIELPSRFFWDAIREPIRFQETIAYLEERGPHHYLDLGASGTLATLLRYLLSAGSQSAVNPILTPYGRCLDTFSSVVRALGSKPP